MGVLAGRSLLQSPIGHPVNHHPERTVDAALKCQQFRRFRRPFRRSAPLIRHTTTPAGAWERTRRLQIQFRETSQSAQRRTLRAVSGNWSCGTSVSFRLQADPFEGQVKFNGAIADIGFEGPQGAGRAGFVRRIRTGKQPMLRDRHEEHGVQRRFRLQRAGTSRRNPDAIAAFFIRQEDFRVSYRVGTASWPMALFSTAAWGVAQVRTS
jgi:hypothetical protein